MSKPVEIEFLMKDGLSPGIDKIKGTIEALKGKASLTSAELDELRQMALDARNVVALLEAQLEELRMVGETAAPDLDQSGNISQIAALEAQVDDLKASLASLQEIAENTSVVPAQLPVAEKKFNGLHNSIQQMAREMPSLAMGPQMFFLAISNNLPIFADEVGRARKEYDDLIRSGQKGTPVWRQILSSLFSWQTALTTGIMLLVMYGDEIVDWAKDLFGAKDDVDELRKAMALKNEVEKEGHSISLRTRAELNKVTRDILVFTGTKEQEKNKVEELNRKYGDTFGHYKTLAEWYDILIQKGDAYVESLFMQAKAQAFIKKALETEEQINDVKAKGKEAFRPMWGDGGKANMFLGGNNLDATGSDPAEVAYQKRIKELEAERENFLKEAEWYQKEYTKKTRDAGLDDYSPTEPTKDDGARKVAEQRIAAEKELGERMLELKRQNEQDSITLYKEGMQQRLAQIQFDYETRKAEIERQAKELSELNKQSGGEGSLTEEQQTLINAAHDNNQEERQKAVAETYRAEFDAMREHLKEYGTFQQQKLAIAEEYAEKIRNATSEGEKLSLKVEMDSSLANIEAQELRANINWSAVFGEFGGMFSDMISPVLQDAKKYMQTDSFKNADQASQEALVEAVQQMEKALGGADKVSFRKLGTEIGAYQKAMADVKDAQIEYGAVYAELISAQKTYIEAMRSGTEEEQRMAEQHLQTAQANADAAAQHVASLQDVATQAQRTMTDTASTLKTSMDGVVSGLQKIASGSISGAYNGLIELGKNAEAIGGKLGDAFGKVSDALEDVPIIGWIVSIVDVFKDGLSVVVGGLLDAVFNAVSGIIGDVLSGDLFVTIGESLLSGIGKIFDSLTWGGFSKWMGSGESDENLQKDIELLTTSNENLRDAIDRLADKMSEVSASEASGVYERQKSLLEHQIANTQEMMRRSGAAYSNGFLGIGGEHSSNYRIDKGMSDDDWARISDVVGREISSAGAFWELSSEEMARVAEEATDLYSRIESLADDGHENASQYMDEYIEYYKQLEELQEAYYEKVTGVSFDSVKSSFRSTLLNMNADAAAHSKNIGNTMLEGIVDGMMSDRYNERLREWYTSFAEAMSEGGLSEDEADELRSLYEGIVSDAVAERDALLKAAGIDDPASGAGTSQSGKSGGFTAISQEQGSKLEGLFVSGQMHWASIDERMEDVSETMSVAVGHLRKIEENTDNCKDSLTEIKYDMKKMIRDGIKVK